MNVDRDHQRALFEALLCECCRDLRELAVHPGANFYDQKVVVRAHEALANRLFEERPPLGEALELLRD